MVDTVDIHQYGVNRWSLSRQAQVRIDHQGQCRQGVAVTVDTVDKRLDSSQDSPIDKIHILVYDLYDMEILECRHS